MHRGHRRELQTWALIVGSIVAAWVVGCTTHINLGEGDMHVKSADSKAGPKVTMFEFRPICSDHECENITGL